MSSVSAEVCENERLYPYICLCYSRGTTYSDLNVAAVSVESDLEFHVLDNRRVYFHPMLFQWTQAVLWYWYASLLRITFL